MVRCTHAVILACLCLATQGCGLILDLTGSEERPRDAGRDPGADGGASDGAASDGAAPDATAMDARPLDGPTEPDATFADASEPCSGLTETIPLEALDDGGTLASSYSTACTTLDLSVTGAPSMMTPLVTGASNPPHEPVIHLAAEGGMATLLLIHFGRPVRDVSFVFEWLSFHAADSYDERLRVLVDGTAVTPSLRWQSNVVVEPGEVRSTARKGDGQVDVERATVLGIELRNADVGDGVGIELHSFTYTIDG